MKIILGISLLTLCFSASAQRVKENIYQKTEIQVQQPVEEAKPVPKAPKEPVQKEIKKE